MLGLDAAALFEALKVYRGSTYVNDFSLVGRTFRVTAQAEGEARQDIRDMTRLRARSESGAMVPIGSVASFRDTTDPYRVMRYNLLTATAVQGSTAPGVSTGTALAAMEGLARQVLPDGFG